MSASLVTLHIFTDVWMGLRESFFMFWDTAWALVLGFSLSGAVQAFVSRDTMQSRLGNHRPAAVARATGYGVISSSCSYAASALAKTLFVRGADFIAAMVFMFASTNLVVELGIVLIVLIGWQFAAAEFVGGSIMIVLLVVVASALLGASDIEKARKRLLKKEGQIDDETDEEEAANKAGRAALRERLRSKAGWADAASYTIADLTMLRREMLVGFLTAGFLAALVPTSLWNSVFLTGHGTWTEIENVLVGPFIALISFVCSIGNIPLAAALWKGGISFGGVVSFVFADLLALPLIFIYRKFYGRSLTLKMVGIFWLVMSSAGLITQALFGITGLTPKVRPVHIVPEHLSLGLTTGLNLAFLLAFAFLYYLYRQRGALGSSSEYATDVVCGMQVQRAHAAAQQRYNGTRYYFCSDRCSEKFEETPQRYLGAQGIPDASSKTPTETGDTEIDPVCGMTVDPKNPGAHREADGVDWYFCGEDCAQTFERNPTAYVRGPSPPKTHSDGDP